jgi:hypothetical protein
MNWSDYEAVWKRQELPVGADADLANLRATFETKRRKMAAAMLVRDWTEIGACVVVVVAYGFYWRQSGPSGWPMGLAILLILGVALIFARERLRVRRLRLGADAPLLTKVEADIAELRHQCRLIGNLWKWYLGPCAGAMAIHWWVIVHRAPAWGPLQGPWFLVGTGLFLVVLLWFAWLINRQALRKRLEPRLAELEKLRRDLTGENT